MPLHVRRSTPVRSAVAGVLLAVLIGACGGPGAVSPEAGGPVDPAGAAASPPGPPSAPSAPQPVADLPCPYLDEATVESTNGQRVASVRISADQPYPACFFYRGDGNEQLRTWVVVATPAVAGATVDAIAPVSTSDLAELPGGWSGGAQLTPDGAVFAVTRQGTAVVVTTNQGHVLSARRVAEQVIAVLGL